MSFLKAITPTIRKEIDVKGHQFAVLWKRPNEDERLALVAEIGKSVEAIELAKTEGERYAATKAYVDSSRKRIHLYIRDWELTDDKNNPVALDDQKLYDMLLWTEYRAGLDQSLAGIVNLNSEDAKAGNSLSADATSPAPTTPEK